jgi:hypothetical protein
MRHLKRSEVLKTVWFIVCSLFNDALSIKNMYCWKTMVFQDMTKCSQLFNYRCFGGTYCLHLQGSSGTLLTIHPTTLHQILGDHAGCLLGLLFDPEDGDNVFLQNIRKLSSHYTKKMVMVQCSIVTAMRIPNETPWHHIGVPSSSPTTAAKWIRTCYIHLFISFCAAGETTLWSEKKKPGDGKI